MSDNEFDLTRRGVLATGVVGTLGSIIGTSTGPEDRSDEKETHEKERKGPNGETIPEGSDDHLNPDRHIVGTTSTRITREITRRADSVRRVLDLGVRGDAVVGRFTVRALDEIRRIPDVRYVEPDRTVRALEQTVPWGVQRIGARQANQRGVTGAGANVSIIDTGIDSQHPDLAANLGTGNAIVSCQGSCREPWDDDDGHGTHVAGTVGAIDNDIGVVGVSPDATLHAVKVLDNRGGGTVSGVARGITWTADQGYDVANMSLGSGSFSNALADACSYAYQRGVLLVGAAGNDYGGPVNYPAALPTVIAVSSTTQNDTLSPFSNVGAEIELAAPGSGIRSTLPGGGYGNFSGTSMAAPHVAGTAALLMARGFTNERTRDRLRQTAEDIGLPAAEQGHGLVDADAAARAVSFGELGTIRTNQPNQNTWHSVAFDGTYTSKPIVIANPVSTNSGAPVHVRVRNVTRNGFEFRLEKWRYLGGRHPQERVSYLAVEPGTHQLGSNGRIVAGRTTATNRYRGVQFRQSFGSTPVVFTQSQTVNQADPIVTRQRRIDENGFQVRVQEEEARGAHSKEVVGWVALLPSRGRTDSGIPFEVKRTPPEVTHRWYTSSFDRSYGSNPPLVGTIQTVAERDPVELRYRNLTATSVQFRAQEERSADRELRHRPEEVGYLVARRSGLL